MKTPALLLPLLCLLAAAWGQSCTLEDNTDYDSGYLVVLYDIKSAQDCCTACGTFEDCNYFSYIKDPKAGEWYQRCFIKSSGAGKKVNNATVAGPVSRPPPPVHTCASVDDNVDYNNGWLSLLEGVPDAETCCYSCSNFPGCKYWSYMKSSSSGSWYQRCFFKSSNVNRSANTAITAGSATPVALPATRTGKRGLAWFNSESCSDLKLMKGVSWIYNWSPTPPSTLMPCFEQLGMEFVPMQWGGGGIVPDLNFTIYSHSKHLLTFNEPNFFAQSNMSPLQAAQAWPTITKVAEQRGMLIGSPAAAACGPDLKADCYAASWFPEPWFDQFFSNCSNCKVDFLTSHIYTCNFTQFTDFLTRLKKYKLPIWLTEFACPASGQNIDVEITFMKQALSFLDNEPSIERYAWFGTRLNPGDGWLGPQVDLLAQDSCALTDLGKLYNGIN